MDGEASPTKFLMQKNGKLFTPDLKLDVNKR